MVEQAIQLCQQPQRKHYFITIFSFPVLDDYSPMYLCPQTLTIIIAHRKEQPGELSYRPTNLPPLASELLYTLLNG